MPDVYTCNSACFWGKIWPALSAKLFFSDCSLLSLSLFVLSSCLFFFSTVTSAPLPLYLSGWAAWYIEVPKHNHKELQEESRKACISRYNQTSVILWHVERSTKQRNCVWLLAISRTVVTIFRSIITYQLFYWYQAVTMWSIFWVLCVFLCLFPLCLSSTCVSWPVAQWGVFCFVFWGGMRTI